MSSFFSKCNMTRRSEMTFKKFGQIIKIPFFFHIKDISNTFSIEEIENELEFYDKDIYFQDNFDRKIEKYKSYLKFVDLSQFTIDVDDNNEDIIKLTKVSGDYRIFKDVDCLYFFLSNILNFDEIDFTKMKIFIKENQSKIICHFIDMIDEELEIGSQDESPNETFMILRCAYELNHTATVFPENKNKSISEFSFRELRVQRVYLARKCELEKMQYDKIMKKSNK